MLDLFASLDANLQFRLAPIAKLAPAAAQPQAAPVADLRGVACPMNFVKTKIALEKVAVGETLDVLLGPGCQDVFACPAQGTAPAGSAALSPCGPTVAGPSSTSLRRHR